MTIGRGWCWSGRLTIMAMVAATPARPALPAGGGAVGSEANPMRILSLPYTIEAPGWYRLDTSISAAEHGLTIRSSGVQLDLAGATLSGLGHPESYGLWLSGTDKQPLYDVAVSNGTIQGFTDGIRCERTRNIRLSDLTICGHASYGIYLSGRSGACNGTLIDNCTICDNGAHGLVLSGLAGDCSDNTVARCTIRSNYACGLYAVGSYGHCDRNVITNCTIRQNGMYGISLAGRFGSCSGNRVRDCVIQFNRYGGVRVPEEAAECRDNRISSGRIKENGPIRALLGQR